MPPEAETSALFRKLRTRADLGGWRPVEVFWTSMKAAARGHSRRLPRGQGAGRNGKTATVTQEWAAHTRGLPLLQANLAKLDRR